MATLSKGIRVGYTAYSAERTSPTYTYFGDITGIPALGASPATQDVTTLDDAMHVYIKGLIDVGGTLDFPCNFTSSLITAVETCVTAQAVQQEFCVEFPSPLLKRAYFQGEASAVFNESVDVDAPITGTLSIVPNSAILWETYTPSV
ncbi:MAG: hypothetical protein WC936_06955 [Candidatus Nanoarchaeia archaeon]|jgi:hypothetical protein